MWRDVARSRRGAAGANPNPNPCPRPGPSPAPTPTQAQLEKEKEGQREAKKLVATLMEELGQQQQQRHARELELEHAAMKAQIAGEREGLVASVLQHKELQGQLARAKGDNLALRSEASELRARLVEQRLEAEEETRRLLAAHAEAAAAELATARAGADEARAAAEAECAAYKAALERLREVEAQGAARAAEERAEI